MTRYYAIDTFLTMILHARKGKVCQSKVKNTEPECDRHAALLHDDGGKPVQHLNDSGAKSSQRVDQQATADRVNSEI
jgi:hypothetical protein